MTNREIFDKVRTHMLKQNAKSISGYPESNYRCAYRGAAGTMCAIGCLIPDSIYKPEMEGKNVWGLCNGYPEIAELFSEEQLDGLLLKLQNIHDNFPPDEWSYEFDQLESSLFTKALNPYD